MRAQLSRAALLFAWAAPLLAACKERPAPESAVPRAQAALAPFKTSLRGALQGAMAEGAGGSPETAVDVCAAQAGQLAAAASTGGVKVGRAAEKRRNPANAPPAWAAPLMTELAASPKDGAYRVVALDGGRVGYAETIVTQGLCLTCHGENVAPPLAARIAAKYPEDRATGFRAGDFRGIFWVELPERAN